MNETRRVAVASRAAEPTTNSAPQRRRLRQEIRQAASACAFVLWLQPRYSLIDGALRGAEAQLRWPHRGSIGTPASFMPLVEECGLADVVANWAMSASCAAAQSWGGMAAPYVSLAVPPGSVEAGRLLGHVAHALASTGLAPERLEIGLGEAALDMEDEDALLALCALADLGIRLTLDEFGGESANLLALRHFPLTALKLDRSLIRDLPHDKAAAALAHGIIGIAHALGLAVVAAGVETAAQRDFLIQAGCDEAQGALFGRLVVAESFPALLSSA